MAARLGASMTQPAGTAPQEPATAPAVTLGLITYRQEAFVAAAVRSALAQDHEPLEIVVCDDASPDRTAEIARECVEAYAGPHAVRLHRNERNLGIGNFNRLMELASGELIVIAHGDDLSRRDRVRRIVDAWRQTRASMISSNWIRIDADGRNLGPGIGPGRKIACDLRDLAAHGRGLNTLGAVLAWERRVFDEFGPLDPERSAITSDYVLPFRAALLKGIHHVDLPLVAVRRHAEQKYQRYIGDDTDSVSLREGQRANQLIQGLYMLETLQVARRKDLKPIAELEEARRLLLRFIVATANDWSKARNLLYAGGRRPRWRMLDDAG
jgi:glycosyltransferase involved in cell wall biosynthesis